MKATDSMDGIKRFNMLTSHRMAGHDFANALCFQYRDHDFDRDDELPDLPRARILEQVRKVLETRADDRNWWRDGVDEDDDADRLWAWADALIRKRFPGLY